MIGAAGQKAGEEDAPGQVYGNRGLQRGSRSATDGSRSTFNGACFCLHSAEPVVDEIVEPEERRQTSREFTRISLKISLARRGPGKT